ncbi:hypothetical protein QOT17_022120 [Balamuthia mandrillaris]
MRTVLKIGLGSVAVGYGYHSLAGYTQSVKDENRVVLLNQLCQVWDDTDDGSAIALMEEGKAATTAFDLNLPMLGCRLPAALFTEWNAEGLADNAEDRQTSRGRRRVQRREQYYLVKRARVERILFSQEKENEEQVPSPAEGEDTTSDTTADASSLASLRPQQQRHIKAIVLLLEGYPEGQRRWWKGKNNTTRLIFKKGESMREEAVAANLLQALNELWKPPLPVQPNVLSFQQVKEVVDAACFLNGREHCLADSEEMKLLYEKEREARLRRWREQTRWVLSQRRKLSVQHWKKQEEANAKEDQDEEDDVVGLPVLRVMAFMPAEEVFRLAQVPPLSEEGESKSNNARRRRKEKGVEEEKERKQVGRVSYEGGLKGACGFVEDVPGALPLREVVKRNPLLVDDVLDKLHTKHSKTVHNKFISSLVAAAVACYTLDIQDRNGDNVLLGRDGRLYLTDVGRHLLHARQRRDVPLLLQDTQQQPSEEEAPQLLFDVFMDTAFRPVLHEDLLTSVRSLSMRALERLSEVPRNQQLIPTNEAAEATIGPQHKNTKNVAPNSKQQAQKNKEPTKVVVVEKKETVEVSLPWKKELERLTEPIRFKGEESLLEDSINRVESRVMTPSHRKDFLHQIEGATAAHPNGGKRQAKSSSCTLF